MTSIYSAAGKNLPCTVLEVGPCVVTQVRTLERDGYEAVQLGYGERSEKHTSKAMQGHFKRAGVAPQRKLVEFRAFGQELQPGDTLKVDDVFTEGEYVSVIGKSKGKGFQGVVKRWNFRTQDATHGNSLSHRAPGSIGQCQTPGRVFKGKKMSGHMGDERVTTQGLEVVRVDAERNLLLIKGAVPGAPGGEVIIRPTVKAAGVSPSES